MRRYNARWSAIRRTLCRHNFISNHYGARQIGWRKRAPMTFFDPLDREIFERALEAAHAAVKANFPRDALDSDEAGNSSFWPFSAELGQTTSLSSLNGLLKNPIAPAAST